MDVPINAKAEGRVLVPWEHRKYPNLTLQDSSGESGNLCYNQLHIFTLHAVGIESMLGGPFTPDWRGDGNVWEAWRRTCSPSSAARHLFSSLRNPFTGQVTNYLSPTITGPGGDFSFSPITSSKLDYCSKPYAHYTQGHFFSDVRTIKALYPVFSPAKAKGFMDIRIPSHYYYGSTKRYTYGWDPVNQELKDVDDMEVPWERKIDKIFWRGASTGGGGNPAGFSAQYHRHRYVFFPFYSISCFHSLTRNKHFLPDSSDWPPTRPTQTVQSPSQTHPARPVMSPLLCPLLALTPRSWTLRLSRPRTHKTTPGVSKPCRRIIVSGMPSSSAGTGRSSTF